MSSNSGENRIAMYREKTGLSQKDFATSCGWRQSTQSNYELGHRQVGTRKLSIIQAVLRRFQIDVSLEDLAGAGNTPSSFVCQDDSMCAAPLFLAPGSTVHYMECSSFVSGQVVVIKVSGALQCRVGTKVGANTIFVPLNSEYPTVQLGEDVTLVGLVTRIIVDVGDVRL